MIKDWIVTHPKISLQDFRLILIWIDCCKPVCWAENFLPLRVVDVVGGIHADCRLFFLSH